jgi:crotonobetainyl-CoA:carnitine CoA-transferase CaiB-like acyl-CoA transferase
LQTDEHLQAVSLIGSEQHPTEGSVASIRSSIRFNETEPALGSVSQPRGRETKDVLTELGYGTQEIEELLSSGAAVAWHQAT